VRNFCLNFVHGSALGSSVGVGVCLLVGFPVTPLAWAVVATGIILSCYIMLFDDKRYQDACPVTRLVRHLFFRPKHWIILSWWLLRWAAYGCKPLEYTAEDDFPGLKFTRRETVEHFATISRSMADFDMQHWFTMEECKTNLKARCEKTA